MVAILNANKTEAGIVENKKRALLPHGYGKDKICPWCGNEIECRTPDDYSDDEIHPCEHCSNPLAIQFFELLCGIGKI